MARNPARGDLVRRIARMDEQIRQLRAARRPADLGYVLTDNNFNWRTLSGIDYGWIPGQHYNPSAANVMRLRRYGNLLHVSGSFRRAWKADGSTPSGWTQPIESIFGGTGSTDPLPDDFTLPQTDFVYRVPIYYEANTLQTDGAGTVYEGLYGGEGYGGLSINPVHIGDTYSPRATYSAVPFRATVYFWTNFVVPFYP